MNETTEMWREHREYSQQKRSQNREKSAQILKENNVFFDEKNGGAHLIVYGREGLVDFWPGTGKWIVRKSGQKGRGVFNLLRFCA